MPRLFWGRLIAEAPELVMVSTVTSIEARVIDPVRFARAGSRATGTLALTQLRRLDDLLFDREGAVSYTVEGYTSAKGQPVLHIGLTGDLALRCQRCLERLPLRLDVQRDIVLVAQAADSDPIEDEDDDSDTILSAGSLDLHDLLEQEIVLSVPMVPRHPEDVCRAGPGWVRISEASSPLSALAALKSQPK
jgi:uncharacterized protein